MKGTRRLLPLVCLLVGGAGVVVCVAGIFGVWLIDARLTRLTENVFAEIDDALVAANERAATAGQRVRAARVTTEELEQSLKNWTKREASDRLTSRLGIDEKAARLASGLQQADHWLEISESSVQLARRALKLTNLTGAPVETEPVDGLLERLASLRAELAEASELVGRICERTAEADEQRTLKERVDRIVRLTLRVIATLHAIDSRLVDFQDRVPEARANAQNLETRIRRSMRIAATSVTLLALWMAAGQLSLCYCGWQRLQQPRPSQPPDGKESSPNSTGAG